MKVTVTGGAGKVGRAVARELLDAGHTVQIIDRAAPPADLRERCEVQYLDLTNRLGVLRALQGSEAIAHLGAIPDPVGGKDLDLFPTNVVGTQYVLAAAEAHDIRRVALASSISIHGMAFQKSHTVVPRYLPFDENHPIENEDVYGASKQCNELTAAMYTRRTGMATTCLRLTWVVDLERIEPWSRRWLERASQQKSPDLWSYVDRRDVGRAFRLALERVESGHHVALLAAHDAWGDGGDTDAGRRARIEQHYPHLLPFLDNGFDYGSYGFIDTRRAQELLSWESRFHWREALERENSMRENSMRENSMRENSMREALAREALAREALAREALAREALAREALAREALAQTETAN